MDTIKNCRMLPVNLSDIGALEERDPNIWQFLRWTIFVQVNYIQETEKSVDHAGEQENKKLKVQVVLQVSQDNKIAGTNFL